MKNADFLDADLSGYEIMNWAFFADLSILVTGGGWNAVRSGIQKDIFI